MQTMTVLLAVALLCLALLSHGTAASGIKGTRTKGYTFNTDVSNLYSLSDDFCAIFGAMLQGKPDAALGAYYNGTSSKAMAYATLAGSEAAKGRQLYDFLFSTDTFQSPADISAAFSQAVETRNPFHVLEITLTLVRGKIMFDFLDLANKHINQVPVALRDLDSAWLLFSGKPGAACPDNLFDIFAQFAPLFGVSYRGVPHSGTYLAWTFGDMQNAIRRKDSAALLASSATVASVYVEFSLQFQLYNAISVDIAEACGNAQLAAAARDQNHHLLPLIEALLKGLHGSSDSFAALKAEVEAGSGFDKISAAVKGIVNGTSISYANLGAPIIPAIKASWFALQGIDVRNCTAI